jgi:hypothetical protein
MSGRETSTTAPDPVRIDLYSCRCKLSLTVLSQTGEPEPDFSVLTGHEIAPDLLGWTPVDPPDPRHETAEQMQCTCSLSKLLG